MTRAVLDEKSGSARHRPAFRLAQPIGAKSANDKSDLKGTRPVLEKLLGERRGDAAGRCGGVRRLRRRCRETQHGQPMCYRRCRVSRLCYTLPQSAPVPLAAPGSRRREASARPVRPGRREGAEEVWEGRPAAAAMCSPFGEQEKKSVC